MAAQTTPDPMPISAMIALVPIKLSASNYLLWYSQFQPLLDCFELCGLIDGSSPRPLEMLTSDTGVTSPNPAFSKWKIKDQKLLGVIFATLFEETMAEVVGCRDSRSAWAALEVAFAHSSESRANQLRRSS